MIWFLHTHTQALMRLLGTDIEFRVECTPQCHVIATDIAMSSCLTVRYCLTFNSECSSGRPTGIFYDLFMPKCLRNRCSVASSCGRPMILSRHHCEQKLAAILMTFDILKNSWFIINDANTCSLIRLLLLSYARSILTPNILIYTPPLYRNYFIILSP